MSHDDVRRRYVQDGEQVTIECTPCGRYRAVIGEFRGRRRFDRVEDANRHLRKAFADGSIQRYLAKRRRRLSKTSGPKR